MILALLTIVFLLYIVLIIIIGGIFKLEYGFLFRIQSFWIGLHYSKHCKRYCLNIIPCCTLWWTKRDGFAVNKLKM